MQSSPNVTHAEVDDRAVLSRRSFLTIVLSVAGFLGLGGLAAPIIRYAFPTVRAEVSPRIRVAASDDLTPLGAVVDFEYQEVPCSLLQLEGGEYVALSRVCTHLGCIVSWEAENVRFYCPCHAGVFSATGEVLAGPPPRPLPLVRVSVEGSEIWAEGWLPG